MKISSKPSKFSSIVVIFIYTVYIFFFIYHAVCSHKHKSGGELVRERWRCLTKVSSCPWKNRDCTNQTFHPLADVSHPGRGSRSLRESAAGSTRSFLKFCVISGSWESADLFPPLWVSVGGRCPVRHSEAEWKASSSSMVQSSLNHFPPSRCSALFFTSLPWFVLPCSTAIYLMELWMQPASCCRCGCIMWMSFRSGCFKFHNRWFSILYQLRCQSCVNKTSSTSLRRECSGVLWLHKGQKKTVKNQGLWKSNSGSTKMWK